MNWRFVFSGLQSTGWSIIVVCAVLFAVTMFVLLRKYEARLVRPTVSRILLTLRLLVLGLLIAVLLQPILTKSWDIDRQSRLLIGFDVSESMETADRHASPFEKLQWAQALGMLGNSATESLLQNWLQSLEDGLQPNWSGDDGDAQLGQIREKHVQGVFAEIEKMPRTEFVRRLLKSSPNNLLEQLEALRPVDLRVFGAEQQSVSGEQLTELLKSDRQEVRPGATDAVNLLTTAITEADSSEIQGIVLFTDGRQTEKGDASSEAARLQSLGIPVYCIPIGSTLSPRDLSIASLEVPQTVFLEDTARVRATITSTGYSGEEVIINLKDGDDVVDQRTVTVGADYFNVEFGIPSDEVGNHEYTISTEVQPGELRDDNNSREFNVSVVDSKSKVMLVEGDARWEFRYLNSALERDKRVDLSVVLLNQPFLKLLNRPFIDNKLPDVASVKEQLANTDILILGDVEASAVSEQVWQLIEESVADDGLTLLVIPGRRFMPQKHASAILKRLLPLSDFNQQTAERYRRSVPGAAPTTFRLLPTVSAADLPLFRLSSAGEERQVDVASLPGHPWAYSGTPKPASSVWANLTIPGVEMSDKPLPAVVHQYYGFGQVVWMGIDSTWRWRFRAGDRWHHRFWGQIVRWAARNKSASGNDQVRLSLSDVVVDETETVEASIRWNPKLAPKLTDAKVRLLIERVPDSTDDENSDAVVQEVVLASNDDTPERYASQLPSLKPGTYTVQLAVDDADLLLEQEVSSELIVQKRTSTELANISCNRQFLQQLSAGTGGELLEPWQLSELLEMIQPEEQEGQAVEEQSLWDTWPAMLLFFFLLTTEWIIRKMNGLP